MRMVFAPQPSQEEQDMERAMGPPPKPPKKSGLFSGGIKLDFGHKDAPIQARESPALSQEVNSIGRRLRLLEDRMQTMREKLQLMDQTVLENNKKSFTEIKVTNTEINELKQKLSEIENKITMVIKELRMSAKKEDVDVMLKYIELWQPQNFITRDQAEKIAREILEEYTH